jgi:hypothetical protein
MKNRAIPGHIAVLSIAGTILLILVAYRLTDYITEHPYCLTPRLPYCIYRLFRFLCQP